MHIPNVLWGQDIICYLGLDPGPEFSAIFGWPRNTLFKMCHLEVMYAAWIDTYIGGSQESLSGKLIPLAVCEAMLSI